MDDLESERKNDFVRSKQKHRISKKESKLNSYVQGKRKSGGFKRKNGETATPGGKA